MALRANAIKRILLKADSRNSSFKMWNDICIVHSSNNRLLNKVGIKIVCYAIDAPAVINIKNNIRIDNHIEDCVVSSLV